MLCVLRTPGRIASLTAYKQSAYEGRHADFFCGRRGAADSSVQNGALSKEQCSVCIRREEEGEEGIKSWK
jgi:hypothetical protein